MPFEKRICPVCGEEFLTSNVQQKYCCYEHQKLNGNNKRTEYRRLNPQPQPEIEGPLPRAVHWETNKGRWCATVPNKLRRFYSAKSPEMAAAKRDEWVRNNMFIELFQEIDKLCQRYCFTINEFYSLLEPIVKAEKGGE